MFGEFVVEYGLLLPWAVSIIADLQNRFFAGFDWQFSLSCLCHLKGRGETMVYVREWRNW